MQDKHFKMRCDAEFLNRIKSVSERDGRTMARLIRDLVKEHENNLNAKEKKNEESC